MIENTNKIVHTRTVKQRHRKDERNIIMLEHTTKYINLYLSV